MYKKATEAGQNEELEMKHTYQSIIDITGNSPCKIVGSTTCPRNAIEFEISSPILVNVESSVFIYYHKREASTSQTSQNPICGTFYSNGLNRKGVEIERLLLNYLP